MGTNSYSGQRVSTDFEIFLFYKAIFFSLQFYLVIKYFHLSELKGLQGKDNDDIYRIAKEFALIQNMRSMVFYSKVTIEKYHNAKIDLFHDGSHITHTNKPFCYIYDNRPPAFEPNDIQRLS